MEGAAFSARRTIEEQLVPCTILHHCGRMSLHFAHTGKMSQNAQGMHNLRLSGHLGML